MSLDKILSKTKLCSSTPKQVIAILSISVPSQLVMSLAYCYQKFQSAKRDAAWFSESGSSEKIWKRVRWGFLLVGPVADPAI